MTGRNAIQSALDKHLKGVAAGSYWKQRTGPVIGDEYVAYALSANAPASWADDEEVGREEEWTVVYYYPADLHDSNIGREHIDRLAELIREAMESIGFSVTYYDGGDFDEIGLETIVFECVMRDYGYGAA
jgi:hypothetical protein